MESFETTISVKNIPDWSVRRAFSELLANAMDAQKEVDKKICDIELKYIQIENIFHFFIRDIGNGIRKSNLFSYGESSKRNAGISKQYHGYNGAGIINSLAVLLRNNFRIKIKSPYICAEAVQSAKENIAFQFYDPEHEDFFPLLAEIFPSYHSGTIFSISREGDFRKFVEEMKTQFIYFSNSRAELMEQTKYGSIYKTPNGEKGGIYLYGYLLTIEGGIYENCHFVYDLVECKEIDDFIRNSDSGNTRRISSRKISSHMRKLHAEIKNNDLIKLARKYILLDSYEFKDKIIQKRYSEKKITKKGDSSEPFFEEEYLIVEELKMDAPAQKSKKKCVLQIEFSPEEEDRILENLRRFLADGRIKHTFL
jgi:hypothetical protein